MFDNMMRNSRIRAEVFKELADAASKNKTTSGETYDQHAGTEYSGKTFVPRDS